MTGLIKSNRLLSFHSIEEEERIFLRKAFLSEKMKSVSATN